MNEGVFIICDLCQGKRKWMALDDRRYVKRQLYKAARQGHSILPESQFLWEKPSCRCPDEPK